MYHTQKLRQRRLKNSLTKKKNNDKNANKNEIIDSLSHYLHPCSKLYYLINDCIFTSYSQCVNCVDCRVM